MLAFAVVVAIGAVAAIAMLNRKLGAYDDRPDPPGVCSCAHFRGGERYATAEESELEKREEIDQSVEWPALRALVAELVSRGVSVPGPPDDARQIDGLQVIASVGEHKLRIVMAAYSDDRWLLSVNNEQLGPPPAEVLPPIVDALAALDRLTDVTWVARQSVDDAWLPDARVVRR